MSGPVQGEKYENVAKYQRVIGVVNNRIISKEVLIHFLTPKIRGPTLRTFLTPKIFKFTL